MRDLGAEADALGLLAVERLADDRFNVAEAVHTDEPVHVGQLLHEVVLEALDEAARDDHRLQLPLLLELDGAEDGVHGLLDGVFDETAGVDDQRV